jgi:hypothetical protein
MHDPDSRYNVAYKNKKEQYDSRSSIRFFACAVCVLLVFFPYSSSTCTIYTHKLILQPIYHPRRQAVIMNTNNTATAPSAPLYVDLLSDDSFYWDAANRGSTTSTATTTTMMTTTPIATVTTITPTARAIYTTTTPSTWIHEDDDRSRSHENQKIVVIPSSSVLLDSSYKPHNHVLATHPPSTATASSSSSSFVGRMEAMAIPQDPPPRYYKGKRVKTKNAHLPRSRCVFHTVSMVDVLWVCSNFFFAL